MPEQGVSDRRGQLAWALADFAREPFFSFTLSLILPPLFVNSLAADPVSGTAWWGYGLSATSLVLVVTAPLAGSLADAGGSRRPWIVLCLVVAASAMASLWFATAAPGRILWTLASVAVAQLAIELSRVYTDSLLPMVARPDETARLSGAAVGLGFAAGIVYLGIGYWLGGQAADELVARTLAAGSGAWLLLFMLPCILLCPQPPARTARWRDSLARGLAELSLAFRRLATQPELRRFLLARMVYWDGTMSLFSFISIIAATVLGWGTREMTVFGVSGLVAGALAGGSSGRLEGWFGTQRTLELAVAAVLTVTVALALLVGVGTPPADRLHGLDTGLGRGFLMLAIIGCFLLGVIMASSRSMLVRLALPDRLGEAFGLYVMVGRASSFLAPLLVAVSTSITSNQRAGVFGVAAALLAAGLWLLRRVQTTTVT